MPDIDIPEFDGPDYIGASGLVSPIAPDPQVYCGGMMGGQDAGSVIICTDGSNAAGSYFFDSAPAPAKGKRGKPRSGDDTAARSAPSSYWG
jgi:hypothetical protein